jgi:hypothetical protein
MRISAVSIGIFVGFVLACGGVDGDLAPSQQKPASSEAPPLEAAPGGPDLDCPEGTVPHLDEDSAEPLTVWTCAYREGGDVLWRGPIRYFRGEREVVRGHVDRWHRTGEWSALAEDGSVVASGRYDEEGKPTGIWTFADGERTWDDDHFEPRGPWTHAGARSVKGNGWEVEVLDARLEAGHVALRTTIEGGCEECEPTPPCAYPGLESPLAGVTLSLHQAGEQLVEDWLVFEPTYRKGECTPHSEATAKLAKAKAAFETASLDPAGRVSLIAARESVKPNRVGGGGWTFDVQGQRVELVEVDRPGIDIELAAPGLAHRDWTYDSTAERVFFFALQVDEVAVFRFVFTTYSACAGGGTLRPEGLIVDGERAAMVLTAVHTSCNGERFETRVSPVFSLAEPKQWAYQ